MPLYSYTTAGSRVIISSMLLTMVRVFSALIGAWVAAAGGSVAAAGGSVAGAPPGASVAGAAGAAVGAAGAHAVRITSIREIKTNRGLRFDLYISSPSINKRFR